MTQAQDVSYLRSLRPFLSKTGSSNHKIESYITRYESGDLTLTQCMRLIYQLDPTSTLVSDNNGLTATTEVICARPIITSSAALEKSSSAYTACAGGGFMRINGPDDSDFGLSLAIGDVTGDSLPELFVGANGNSGNGNLYVFADIATGLSSPATVSSVSFTISGLSNGDIGGSTITSDINNDGIADIIAGDANAGSSNEGKVYIFYGESSFDSSLTTSNASVTITGSSSSEGIGREVAVGDLNGDGIPDIAITSTAVGKVWVFYSTSLTSSALTSSSADVTITGADISFGSSIAVADVVGTSVNDIIVGSTSSGSGDEGEVIIFDGSSLQTTMDSTNIDTTITGDEDNGFFGTSLATGNIIGDSGIDLLVGASQQGTAYVIDKNTIGSITADNADIVMSGVGLNNRFGRSVGIGDFDGDGDQDIAVGATGVTTGGATYIFYNIGTATPFPSSASSADVTIATSGSDFIDFGAEIATGDFDKDSKTDLAIADNNDDSNIVIIILGEGLTGVSDINLGTGAVS